MPHLFNLVTPPQVSSSKLDEHFFASRSLITESGTLPEGEKKKEKGKGEKSGTPGLKGKMKT